MKIDFDMLDKMVAAGASGAVVLAFLREQDARKAPRRAADRVRKTGGKRRNGAESMRKVAEKDRDDATLNDTPRARLFREGKPALLTLGIADSRAGGLIVQWLKLTSDDDQLVLATILRAQSLAVAEAPSWILATLKGKTNGDGTGPNRANSAAGQSGSAAIIAGVATAAERRGRERGAGGPGAGQAPQHAGPTKAPDLELFGTGHG